MNYEEARNYLEGVGKSGMNLGLSRMRELCRRLGNPEQKLSFIHVAGTNGKGSVSAYISSVLAVNGYLVGRFVSPAVFQYEEFIQYEEIRGKHMIDRELFAQTASRVRDAAEQMSGDGWETPTLFEQQTAMAFLAFCHWQCRVVVLEVGLGGREDATNVAENILAAVITPISLDHRGVLGDTISEIAQEKAGIIKGSAPVFTLQHEPEALSVIERRAKEMSARCHAIAPEEIDVLRCDLTGSVFSFRGENYRTGMIGPHQAENAALAVLLCQELSELCGPDFPPLDVVRIMVGIRETAWRGRFEKISENPLVILDGAHNPDGVRAMLLTAQAVLPGRTLHAVMGVFVDKDYEKMTELASPHFADVVTVTPPGGRGLDGGILADAWREQGCPLASAAASPEEALQEAKRRCAAGDAVIVFGSLSFLGRIDGKRNY